MTQVSIHHRRRRHHQSTDWLMLNKCQLVMQQEGQSCSCGMLTRAINQPATTADATISLAEHGLSGGKDLYFDRPHGAVFSD